MNRKLVFIAFVVSLGGFLFGFDAGIISGVMSFAGPEFELNEIQSGWVVSAPSFAAMIAMLFSGRLSDLLGRRKLLIFVAFLYAISAVLSAAATSYEILYIARMIGGLAFGAALVLAPMYIAEISTAENRGKLVTIQQLNIVFGFFAAFLSNYFFNKYNTPNSDFLTDENVWRWMLGVELIPAILYFIFLFFVPKSPRWLYLKNHISDAKEVLIRLHGRGHTEVTSIENSILTDKDTSTLKLTDLLKGRVVKIMTDAKVEVELEIAEVHEKNHSIDLEKATMKNDWWPKSEQWTTIEVSFTNGYKKSYGSFSEINLKED